MKIGQQECACLKFHYLGRERTGEAGRWAGIQPEPCYEASDPMKMQKRNPNF